MKLMFLNNLTTMGRKMKIFLVLLGISSVFFNFNINNFFPWLECPLQLFFELTDCVRERAKCLVFRELCKWRMLISSTGTIPSTDSTCSWENNNTPNVVRLAGPSLLSGPLDQCQHLDQMVHC